MDIQQELERSIGRGPALPTPEERLAAGRWALRRRRIAVGGAAVVVAALMVTPLAIAAGGGDHALEPAPAGPAPVTTSAPEPEPTDEATEKEPRWRAWESIRFTGDGQLEIRPGVEVLDRVDGYLRGTRWEHSVAMEIRWDGTVHWVSAEWDRGSGSSSSDTEANDGWADFRSWVVSQAAANMPEKRDPGTGYPDLVVARGDGTFGEAPGATILEQRASPGLPESFAPPTDPTGAAYVEKDGVRYLVLARPGDLVVVRSDGHGDSLDELLTWARERYESGEGLL